ncbi:carbonic anhydrase [Streptomyces sp. XM4193]|uniref:carbonic anhydrase n=1 Tax=Streptomyces sp. XM4193 TaxID=2929782 RepID=UPI001FFA3A92|nr:carbonic anhydrase [Streptomyces sp. XM4193]MCK1794923.1 carbonic anhydrase [Streptomyces sp. XM4193]
MNPNERTDHGPGDFAAPTAIDTTGTGAHAGPRAGTGRRALLRAVVGGTAVVGAGLALGGGAVAAPARGRGLLTERPSTPAAALKELAEGNQRWRRMRQEHPHESEEIRQVLVSGQNPFAVVLGCIDSRVPPELVFDQGLGDLMTVRSAGEVLDSSVIGSVAYGVLELDIPLILVLGHQSCGAVAAAVEADESGEELPGHLQYVVEQIFPSIDHSQHGDARVDATVTAHALNVRRQLAAEPDLAERVADGRLAVVAARYELADQRVHRIS